MSKEKDSSEELIPFLDEKVQKYIWGINQNKSSLIKLTELTIATLKKALKSKKSELDFLKVRENKEFDRQEQDAENENEMNIVPGQ